MHPITINDFKKIIWQHYSAHGRLFDWRGVDDPYKVFISEVMLQQTQTARVAIKYLEFIARFPDFNALASAPLKDVLLAWQGMGYNRRGMYLHRAAQTIMQDHRGILPNDPEILDALPGIGAATASSICAFAFNRPTIFIETNIRAVFIHFYFHGREKVHDKEIMPLIEVAVDHDNPREWYYALMDYGVLLKKSLVNPSRKSAHHAKQSKFEDSDRQIRGMILKVLTNLSEPIMQEKIMGMINKDQPRVLKILNQMIKEEFVQSCDGALSIRDK
ncbi:endonuclease III [soil metagenome]